MEYIDDFLVPILGGFIGRHLCSYILYMVLETVVPVGSIGSVRAVGNVAVALPVHFWCPASVSTYHACPMMLVLDF